MAVIERFKALEGGVALTIQEVSRRTGLSEPTLRYYEKIGLIDHVERDESSGHRRYGPETFHRIEALACLRVTGMSVRDMRAYLSHLDEAAHGEGSTAAAEMTTLFERNVERLDDEIQRLLVRRNYLRMKADVWAARRDGDVEAEKRAVGAVVEALNMLR